MITATPLKTANAIEPGIYHNFPADLYHALSYASNSRLGLLDHCPAYVKESMENPERPTPAKILGDAGHYCILQPKLYATRFIVADQCCATTGRGSRCSKSGSVSFGDEWFCEQHASINKIESDNTRRILAQDKFDLCLRMSDKVQAHPIASAFLAHAESIETSAIWDDANTGIRQKMRADILCNEPRRVIVDLKTTRDAKRDAFEKAIFSYGYFRQAAMYLDGMNALGQEYGSFLVIAVETKPPFAVAVYRILDDVIEEGRKEIRRLLAIWSKCERSCVWPGYPETIQDISLPAWGWRDLEKKQLEELA